MSGASKVDVSEIVGGLDILLHAGVVDNIRNFLVQSLLRIREQLARQRDKYTEGECNRLFATGVALRGILDFINIRVIVSRANWSADTKTLDLVWTRMWDCQDRLNSYPEALIGPVINDARRLLETLHKIYHANFGAGVYMSTDLKVKKRVCSICNDNIKKCDHVPGRLYGGVICRQIMEELEVLGASIVMNPEDPRCRIWPWNYNKEENSFTAPVITMFAIDDFIQDDEWPKPNIKWPEGLP